MKNKLLLIALVAVIAFSMSACDDLTKDKEKTKEEAGGSYGSGFTTVEAFGEWLSKQPENTPATAYNVKLKTNDFGGASNWWYSVGYMLGNSKKYVYFDISDSPMTSIQEWAFRFCNNIVGITMGNKVTSIDGEAFRGCSNLISVTIGNSVTSIGEGAFGGSSLTSVTIPDSVTSISNSAFDGCAKLTSVTISNSVPSIEEATFANCTSLKSVIIPNSVTSIGRSAFWACSSLTGLTIGNSVKNIEYGAFANCTGLTSVIIPDSVTTLRGFNGCTGLTSVTIGNGVTSIGEGAFSGAGLTSVTIPASVNNIEFGAFYDCEKLTSVTFKGTIHQDEFKNANAFQGSYSFPGNLRNKFYEGEDNYDGTPGTYTRSSGSNEWTRQEE